MAEVNGNLLVKGQHLNLKPETFVTDPLVGTLGAEARVWFNSTTKALKLFDGDAIIALGAGGADGQTEQEVLDAIAAALIPYAESADVTTEISTAVTGLVNNTQLNNAIDNALAGLDFQADIYGLETSYVDTPGRYIYIDGTQITGGLPASAGDIVDVDNTGAVTAIAYDVSVAGPGALVWNRAGISWLRWNGTDWADFGGLTGFTAGDGIEKTGDVVSVKLDGATLTKGVNGLKVGDLSATYVTPAAQTTAIATATADFQTEAEVSAAITTATSTFQTAAQVGTLIDTALTPYAESADVTTEIATAVTGLASTASVTTAIDNALAGLDFQADVLGLESDFAGVAGRYIMIDGFSGITAVSSNANDIVEVDAAGQETALVYDVSVEGPGALVWNRDAAMWLRWNGTNWAEFGGLTGITPGDGIETTGDVVSVKLDGATLTKGVNGLKVGDLSATYVTPAAQTTVLADYVLETALTTAIADFVTDAEVATQIGTSFFAFDSGATSATTHTVTHNLGFQFPIVQVIDRATNMSVIPESIEYTSVNELVITLGVAATLRASVSWVNA